MTASFRHAAFGLLAICFLALTGPGMATAQETGAIPLDAIKQQMQAERTGSVRPPPDAVTNAPMEPGVTRPRDRVETGEAAGIEGLEAQGVNSDATIWGEIRHGESFTTQVPGSVTGFLVQDAGMWWEDLRDKGGPLQTWFVWSAGGMLGLLVLFYLLRGRVRIEHGWSGRMIERFKGWERFGHWLLATSFILLALTGINLLFGKDYLMPLIGKEAFASISATGKWVHNNIAWAFMVALVWIFVAWVAHNLPSRLDLVWLAKGGGLFSKGVHPPSRKFNAGQKIIFWGTIVMGASISASGVSLLFPYELPMFAATFEKLNQVGISQALLGRTLATDLTLIQEMQYAQFWHTVVAIAMTVMILAHIYIGSLGMQGAFAAMGSGMVDRNWAIEHHSLWVEEREGEGRRATPSATPAE